MRAVVCESWRSFDALELKEVPRPPMRPRGVRIRIEASGVSFATQLVVEGKYQRKPPLPFIPGTEVVGTVIEAAPDAEAPPVGTRVFAVLDWGGYAEEVVADDIHVIALEPFQRGFLDAPRLAVEDVPHCPLDLNCGEALKVAAVGEQSPSSRGSLAVEPFHSRQ